MRTFTARPAVAMALALLSLAVAAVRAEQPWTASAAARLRSDLGTTLPPEARARLDRGLRQVGSYWRAGDGDSASFDRFVRTHFAADPAVRDTMFSRFQRVLEVLDGHLGEVSRVLKTQADLDLGPIRPFDELFAGYDPGAHVADDFFDNKLAFVVLLNFPLTTLAERLTEGMQWSRRAWAEARLAQRFSRRVPADVYLAIARATAEADQYIAGYNIWMHHILAPGGERPFPPKMRLLIHWNLRDQLKAEYADAQGGFARQQLIQQVMERIVSQTIPAAVIDNPNVDWSPVDNTVTPAAVRDADLPSPAGVRPTADPEPDRRYGTLLKTFQAARLADPYSPLAPTLIARRFDEGREIPEEQVRAMLLDVVTSPLVPRVAALIRQRLGRPLEPFDIWYNGFRPRGAATEAQLDALTKAKYPTPDAFKRDIPALLLRLGFSAERAAFIAGKIEVDPARGSGHAMGAGMREASVRLRTRVGPDGMNYKGYSIAVHELGHNVEQVLSLHDVDYTLLQGVPNTAFTEALAFVFQARDQELLGLSRPDGQSDALKTLNDFWGTYEIAGVALLDMEVWHWMYEHPAATPAELKQAVLAAAKSLWNRHYAPVFGRTDVTLLAIYSHMIHSLLYLPDYPLGHLIAHQIEEQMKRAGSVGAEFQRMARAGAIAPDLWMKNATGSPVGAGGLLSATERALGQVAR